MAVSSCIRMKVHGSLILMADRIIDLIYLKYLKAAISYHKKKRGWRHIHLLSWCRTRRQSTMRWFIATGRTTTRSDPYWGRCDVCQQQQHASFRLDNGDAFGATLIKTFQSGHCTVFYRAGYIESWGRGIQKIYDTCKNLGSDLPEYIVHGEDIMVKFAALQSAKVIDTKAQRVMLNLWKNL